MTRYEELTTPEAVLAAFEAGRRVERYTRVTASERRRITAGPHTESAGGYRSALRAGVRYRALIEEPAIPVESLGRDAPDTPEALASELIDAQPFTAENDATRVWQLFRNPETARKDLAAVVELVARRLRAPEAVDDAMVERARQTYWNTAGETADEDGMRAALTAAGILQEKSFCSDERPCTPCFADHGPCEDSPKVAGIRPSIDAAHDDAAIERMALQMMYDRFPDKPRDEVKESFKRDVTRDYWIRRAKAALSAAGIRAGGVPESEVRALYKHYVNTLESGRDRIISLGGECDPVDKMEASDPVLARIRKLLAAAPAQQQGEACNVCGGDCAGANPPVIFCPLQQGEAHPDDIAVDKFAVAMKAKLAKARAKGMGGWDDKEDLECHLSNLLRSHVEKGDPRDVANFCCFLWNRGESIQPAPNNEDTGHE